MSTTKNDISNTLMKGADSLRDTIDAANYKDYVLELERTNLKNIDKEEKKAMVAKIIRTYEEAKKNGNSQCKNY